MKIKGIDYEFSDSVIDYKGGKTIIAGVMPNNAQILFVVSKPEEVKKSTLITLDDTQEKEKKEVGFYDGVSEFIVVATGPDCKIAAPGDKFIPSVALLAQAVLISLKKQNLKVGIVRENYIDAFLFE